MNECSLRLALLIMVMGLMAGACSGTSRAPGQAPDAPGPPAALSREALRNTEYLSEWTQDGSAPLTDGQYSEEIVPGAASKIEVRLSDSIAYGTLSDGQEAAAVILVTTTGGSGSFYDLGLVVDQNGGPENTAITLIGDRVKINSLSLEDGEILLDMIIQGPEDPMCCPTQHVSRRYALQDGELILVEEQVLDE